MTQSTGDGTDQGSTPRRPGAPQTSPDAPAAATTGAAPAAPAESSTVRLHVTGPVFTDAVEVVVDGNRVTVGPGVTEIPSDQVDAVIAAAADIDVIVEREEG